MSTKEAYFFERSREDAARTKSNLDGNIVEITKCVKNAEIYISTSRKYLNASKDTIESLKDGIVHVEADINTAEECIMESERRILNLKHELQSLFNKTFYDNIKPTLDESSKKNNDNGKTWNSPTADDNQNTQDKLNGILTKYAEASYIDPTNYKISYDKYEGVIFVIMESKASDYLFWESSDESTDDSEIQNESLCKIEQRSLPRICLKDKRIQTEPLIEINDQVDDGSKWIPTNYERVTPCESKCPVAMDTEYSTKKVQSRQSLSKTFLRAKLERTKPLMQDEKFKHQMMGSRKDFFINESPPSVMTSEAEDHLTENLLRARLDELVNSVMDNKASNTSKTSFRFNMGTTEGFSTNHGDETGSIPKKRVSNLPKTEFITSRKVERRSTKTDKCPYENQIQDEALEAACSSSENSVKRVYSVDTPPSHTSALSKTMLSKSVSENNLIEFSPKPLSKNFKNMSCHLKNDVTLINDALQSCFGGMDFLVKATNSGISDTNKHSKRQAKKDESLNRFKSVDSLGLMDGHSYRSDNFLTPQDKYGEKIVSVGSQNSVRRKTLFQNTPQSNQAVSLPRISKEFEEPEHFVFFPVLDGETSGSDDCEIIFVPPEFQDSCTKRSSFPFNSSLNERFYPQKCNCGVRRDGTSMTTSNFGRYNGKGSISKTFNQDLNETESFSFPNCDIFSVVADLSGSTSAQVSDHSINNRSPASLNESSMKNRSPASLNESSVNKALTSDDYCNDYRRNSAESFATASEASLKNKCNGNYTRDSDKSMSSDEFCTSGRPFTSIPFSDCLSRGGNCSSSLTKLSFNPRFDSCSSPAPDYSP